MSGRTSSRQPSIHRFARFAGAPWPGPVTSSTLAPVSRIMRFSAAVDQVDPRHRAPVAEQPVLDVLGRERLLEQRVVLQVDHRRGDVVRRPAVELKALDCCSTRPLPSGSLGEPNLTRIRNVCKRASRGDRQRRPPHRPRPQRLHARAATRRPTCSTTATSLVLVDTGYDDGRAPDPQVPVVDRPQPERADRHRDHPRPPLAPRRRSRRSSGSRRRPPSTAHEFEADIIGGGRAVAADPAEAAVPAQALSAADPAAARPAQARAVPGRRATSREGDMIGPLGDALHARPHARLRLLLLARARDRRRRRRDPHLAQARRRLAGLQPRRGAATSGRCGGWSRSRPQIVLPGPRPRDRRQHGERRSGSARPAS